MKLGIPVLSLLLHAAVAQDTDYLWNPVGSRIEVAPDAVITGADLAAFKATGFSTFGVDKGETAGATHVDTITWPDGWIPPTGSGFEFAIEQIPYNETGMNLPPAINEGYLLSDLFVVSIRADNGQTESFSRAYRVTSTRVRDPATNLPIPVAAEERFGELTYETGERREFFDVPMTCPAGFEYRLVDVDRSLDSQTCLCPASCTSEQASCEFSGSGRYAISVVPEWLCATDDITPVPRNEDDPINEDAAIAAGTILSVLFLCCMVVACMLCVNAGPKDDHWNHAPRKPGALPLPPNYEDPEPKPAADPVIQNPTGPKSPPRILPDGNPYPYSISDLAPLPGSPTPPQLMPDPRRPAPTLASPRMPDPFPDSGERQG